MKQILIVVVAAFSITANAESSGKVTQVFKDSKKVVAEYSAPPTDIFVDNGVTITGSSGDSCEGRVISKAGNKVVAQFSGCSDFANVAKAGIKLEKSDTPVAAAEESNQPADLREGAAPKKERFVPRDSSSGDRVIKFGVGVHIAAGNSLTYSDANFRVSGVSTDAEVKYEWEAALGLSIEVAMMEPESWGFSAGYQFEGAHKIDQVTMESGGTTYSGKGADFELQVSDVYANAIYRWDQLYLPFGLNYSFVKVKNAPLALKDVEGGVGMQVALGVNLTEHLAAEFGVRVLMVNANGQTIGTDTADLGRGAMGSAILGLKGYF